MTDPRLRHPEAHLVRDLGERIGYGSMMQLAELIWDMKWPGAAFSIGPCTAFLVACPHPQLDSNGHCEWCCGSGRVTKRVLEAIETYQAGID